MELELKVETDNLGKKVTLPGREVGDYTAHAFEESPQGIVSLTAIVEGRKLISHYEKDDEVWIRKNSVRSGPLIVGHPTYKQGTQEYQAFELLSKE